MNISKVRVREGQCWRGGRLGPCAVGHAKNRLLGRDRWALRGVPHARGSGLRKGWGLDRKGAGSRMAVRLKRRGLRPVRGVSDIDSGGAPPCLAAVRHHLARSTWPALASGACTHRGSPMLGNSIVDGCGPCDLCRRLRVNAPPIRRLRPGESSDSEPPRLRIYFVTRLQRVLRPGVVHLH